MSTLIRLVKPMTSTCEFDLQCPTKFQPNRISFICFDIRVCMYAHISIYKSVVVTVTVNISIPFGSLRPEGANFHSASTEPNANDFINRARFQAWRFDRWVVREMKRERESDNISNPVEDPTKSLHKKYSPAAVYSNTSCEPIPAVTVTASRRIRLTITAMTPFMIGRRHAGAAGLRIFQSRSFIDVLSENMISYSYFHIQF